ncbi:Uncharacterized protein APZ42_027406 [Daphnia magna]|uniref:Uncharacterized protein n=1 Tax=Daphnia magna TaxID=35525 RepID=A0A164RJJ7_9CRUS|nr:Uncharacterized protein APZ42_027406 [Daphnia magna]
MDVDSGSCGLWINKSVGRKAVTTMTVHSKENPFLPKKFCNL